MNRAQVLERVSIDPNICFGKPCIKGHRIWVSLILDFLASGLTIQQILSGAGYTVATEAEQDLTSAFDADLIEVCRQEARCLVTLDLDFSNQSIDQLGIAVNQRVSSHPVLSGLHNDYRLEAA